MKRRFANSFEFDPAKPLAVPYGAYRHKKTGTDQLVDRATALAWAADVSAAKASGAPGLPVYVGHPDVPELAARFPDKGAKGWVTSVSAGDSGCELAVEWCDAPAPGAFIFFSPYMAGEQTASGEAHIDGLISVGLTNRPNSTRFRLPNEAGGDDPEEGTAPDPGQHPERKHMKKLLDLLGLPEAATEDEAAAALQTLLDEKADLARKAELSASEAAAAKTAAESAGTALANERESRIGLLLDCALADGRVSPATRPVWAGRLRRDFANEAEALGREKPAFKTRTELPNEGPDGAPGILARYEAMPEGPDKDAFLRTHAVQINDARVALKR